MSVDQIKGSENGQGLRIGIVQARFNEEFGKESLEACLAELKKLGVAESDILVCSVPGALEVPLVLLQLGNTAEYLVYLMGIFWAGALPVFCLPQHRTSELTHFAARADAAAHVYSSRTPGTDFTALYQDVSEQLQTKGLNPPVGIDAAEPLVPLSDEQLAEPFVPAVIQNTDSPRASEQVAFLQLSGGTTGVSKLIPRTHAAYLYSVRGSADICNLTCNTTMLVALPAF